MPNPIASMINPSAPLYAVARWNSAIPIDKANTPEQRLPTAVSRPTQSSCRNLKVEISLASGENLVRKLANAPNMAPKASDVKALTRLRYQNGGWSLIVAPHLSAISPSHEGMRDRDTVTIERMKKDGKE